MTEEEKQLLEAAKEIIERDKEKQLVESAKRIIENDSANFSGSTVNKAAEINVLAIISLTLGILSFFIFGIIFGAAAVVLGFIALNTNQKNRGMAWGGIITGACGLVLYLLILMGTISFSWF